MKPDFPMNMTIRCYACGKVFDAVLSSKDLHRLPCPACGKVEEIHLAEWQRKAAAWNEKMTRKMRRGL